MKKRIGALVGLLVTVSITISLAKRVSAAGIALQNLTNLTTIKAGDNIRVRVTPGGLLPSKMYAVQIALVRGDYPQPTNYQQVCSDSYAGLGAGNESGNWYASQKNVAYYLPENGEVRFGWSENSSGQFESGLSFIQTVTPYKQAGKVRLYAILMDQKYEGSNPSGVWCDSIVRAAVKTYTITGDTIADDSGDNGGDDGGSGGGSSVTKIPNLDVKFDGSIASSVNLMDTNAQCQGEITFKLPGNLGQFRLGSAGLLGICGLSSTLNRLITVLLILAYIVFIAAIIYSGIMLTVANTDEAAAKAKKNLTWAVVGVLIVFLSSWLVPTIINIFGDLPT